jgi:S-adenosylmethionine:tRNA ribosyltransferase-isomerase
MKHPKEISILDYTYELPEERIAFFPLEKRDQSKLMVYKNGTIHHRHFYELDQYLPENSCLVFNNSKVIHARIQFEKSTGGKWEVFCLQPVGAKVEYQEAMLQTGRSTWDCLVKGISKWKTDTIKTSREILGDQVNLTATRVQSGSDSHHIEFSWAPEHYSFAEILDAFGDMPLPPYIKRKADTTDEERYQTIYAEPAGSVAAPTAGLHFTDAVMDQLKQKSIPLEMVTLHVGAGTFKPVKSDSMEGHEMHQEWLEVDRDTIHRLAETDRAIIAVGTTSLRTLETLYWFGVKTIKHTNTPNLELNQWEIYDHWLHQELPSRKDALKGLITWMEKNQQTRVIAQTQLLIAPGYPYQMIRGLITNFHQPQSTLLLLVAALLGEEWKNVYTSALENNYRFLSYGDSSLLLTDEL